MFGVVFDGHPDLRRILMPEDYEGYPAAPRLPDRRRAGAVHLQRRAELREVTSEPLTEDYRKREESITLSSRAGRARSETHELLTLNIGPHHPATHGVLRLIATLEGEVVRDIKPIIGYVHTGIEKTAEDKSYWKVIPVDRADGLPGLLLQRDGVLRRGRDAARRRGAAARPVPARDPPRAQPDHVPPGVARHERAGPRRDLDVLVLLPRARDDPRPVRDVLRPADAHALHPGRRRDGGHPARVRREAARVPRRDADARRPVRRPAGEEPDRPRSGCAAPASLDERDAARRSASPARCCARPATRGTCARRSRTRATTTSTSRSRSARSATTTTATASATPSSTSR